MTKTEKKLAKLDNIKYGVSFSIKQCRNFDINPDDCLDWLIKQGFRRFRLMSYWDEIEKHPDKFDFSGLDKQIAKISKVGGEITLCLGARQPRWPENHWTQWVWEMDKTSRDQCLIIFLEKTVNHYKKIKNIVSYQLENEALLSNFGERVEIDRRRLEREYRLVKKLDPKKPVIMTTSSAFGIPIIGPIPDMVGFSFYTRFFNSKLVNYQDGKQTPLSVRLRAWLIKILWQKKCFIHELQLEPWGPKNIWEISLKEQNKSMDPDQIKTNIDLAKQTKMKTIDLWGGEWWYWRTKVHKDNSIWQAVKNEISF